MLPASRRGRCSRVSATITHLPEVGSTNDWLLERVDVLADGHWVIADRQTAGRGRRGRAWHDGSGNLMASVLVKPQSREGPLQQLSFVAALALHDVLATLTGADRLRLKWPNDLLLDARKLSGILLERAGDPLVIGFGVNIVDAPENVERPAISLVGAGVATLQPKALLDRLAASFATRRGEWRVQGFAAIREAWLVRASGLGDRIAARLGGETVTGLFEGIEGDGALSLRLDDGGIRVVHAGEVFAP